MAIIYPEGTVTITVASGSKLAIYSDAVCKIYKKVAYPNQPDSWVFVANTTAGAQYTTTAFSAATVVRIEAGAASVYYETGASPVIDSPLPSASYVGKQTTPTAKTTAATLTIAELLIKIIIGNHSAGATQAYTLPTGTLTDAGVTMDIDDSFDWVLMNLSAAATDTITLTAATSHSIVGNPIVQSSHSSTGGIYGNSAQFRTRKTAANTFVTYRIA